MFGLREDTDAAIEAVEALPIVRKVEDYDAWIAGQAQGSRSTRGGELSRLTERGDRCFLLGRCRPRAAGPGRANTSSMLVHVTRFKTYSSRCATQIADDLEDVAEPAGVRRGRTSRLRDPLKSCTRRSRPDER